MAYGYLENERGNYDIAARHLEEARKLHENNHFLQDFTVNVYSLLADAYMGMGDPGLKRTGDTCRRALKAVKRLVNHHCSALRVNAKYFALLGRKKKAEKLFQKSIESARKISRKYEAAKSCYEYGNFLDSQNRKEAARENWRQALEIFREIGAKAYEKRCEDMLGIKAEDKGTTQERLTQKLELSSIISASHNLSSILDLDSLLEKIMDISIEITGAERGLLFLYPEKGGELELKISRNISAAKGEKDELSISRSTIKKVEGTKTSVLVVDALTDTQLRNEESVVRNGLRSILCVPLISRESMIGLVYLDNRLVGGLFNEEKLELLKTLLIQAAISIENARATSELKRMQNELKEYASTLEEKVKERTGELANKNELLQEQMEKVKEANQKKTEFVSDVSHELRTPLASIKGFVSTIRSDKEMDEKTREDFLRIVEDESDRLTRIIEGLLDISRIEAGRLKMNIKQFQLTDMIFRNIESVQKLAKERNISIEQNIPQTLPLVFADQDKTAQIIINLLSNAIKYNKEGGKVIVSAGQDDGHVKVDVRDTGIGITERDLPHIFEKFYRAEKENVQAPGTGLGLALTKSLVEVQRGNMTLESKYGEGSKFSFTLPTSLPSSAEGVVREE